MRSSAFFASLRLISVLVFVPGVAAAQPLSDPTRPPAAALQRAAVTTARAETPGPVLQSVLIGRERRSAMISGETVAVGESFGTARVVRITETEVLLKGMDGMTTLKLFPQVDKRASQGSAKPAPVHESQDRIRRQ